MQAPAPLQSRPHGSGCSVQAPALRAPYHFPQSSSTSSSASLRGGGASSAVARPDATPAPPDLLRAMAPVEEALLDLCMEEEPALPAAREALLPPPRPLLAAKSSFFQPTWRGGVGGWELRVGGGRSRVRCGGNEVEGGGEGGGVRVGQLIPVFFVSPPPPPIPADAPAPFSLSHPPPPYPPNHLLLSSAPSSNPAKPAAALLLDAGPCPVPFLLLLLWPLPLLPLSNRP